MIQIILAIIFSILPTVQASEILEVRLKSPVDAQMLYEALKIPKLPSSDDSGTVRLTKIFKTSDSVLVITCTREQSNMIVAHYSCGIKMRLDTDFTDDTSVGVSMSGPIYAILSHDDTVRLWDALSSPAKSYTSGETVELNYNGKILKEPRLKIYCPMSFEGYNSSSDTCRVVVVR